MRQNVKEIIVIVFLIMSVNQNDAFASKSSDSLLSPKIHNGTKTNKYPFVAELLFKFSKNAPWQSICSATLVSPYTLVTAAHCVCEGSGSSCQINQTNSPNKDLYGIFLQNAGFFGVESISIPEDFSFPYHDYAVINLVKPVQGIAAANLSNKTLSIGSDATIVGYGLKSNGLNEYTGLKRTGRMTTASCSARGVGLSDNSFICWNSTPDASSANTCSGDSGGALFSHEGGLLTLAGITSGGIGQCDTTDFSFDTSVATYRDKIIDSSTMGLSTATLGYQLSTTSELTGSFSSGHAMEVFTVNTKVNTKKLTVTANTESFLVHSYKLSVYDDSLSLSSAPLCESSTYGIYQACELTQPLPETLRVEYEKVLSTSSDEYQLTVSEFEQTCSLDIDGNGQFDAQTDGVLMTRYLFGFRGDVFIKDAVSQDGIRQSANDISEFLGQEDCQTSLDINADGEIDALSDGLLIMRYLSGLTGDALINGTGNEMSQNDTEEKIVRQLLSLKK
jgi:V8-like Glu-specific endopeptidase